MPRQAWAWPQLGRMPAAGGLRCTEHGEQQVAMQRQDILQESVLLRLHRGLRKQQLKTLCTVQGCGDKQQCRVLALGVLHPLLSTTASCTGCLLVAPGALGRPATMKPYLMQSQPAFIMVTPKTALEYCSQEASQDLVDKRNRAAQMSPGGSSATAAGDPEQTPGSTQPAHTWRAA